MSLIPTQWATSFLFVSFPFYEKQNSLIKIHLNRLNQSIFYPVATFQNPQQQQQKKMTVQRHSKHYPKTPQFLSFLLPTSFPANSTPPATFPCSNSWWGISRGGSSLRDHFNEDPNERQTGGIFNKSLLEKRKESKHPFWSFIIGCTVIGTENSIS